MKPTPPDVALICSLQGASSEVLARPNAETRDSDAESIPEEDRSREGTYSGEEHLRSTWSDRSASLKLCLDRRRVNFKRGP